MAIASTATATPTASTKPPASAQEPPKELPMERMVNTGTKIAAWLLTVLYVVVALVLLWRFGLGDGSGGNWERALIFFNAFSAIGFAAVGVLLGTTVQQVNVANTQKEAVNAKASEANAKKSESNMAKYSTELVGAAAESLAKTLGIKTSSINDPALWAGHLPNSVDERLRQAITNMDEVLKTAFLNQLNTNSDKRQQGKRGGSPKENPHPKDGSHVNESACPS